VKLANLKHLSGALLHSFIASAYGRTSALKFGLPIDSAFVIALASVSIRRALVRNLLFATELSTLGIVISAMSHSSTGPDAERAADQNFQYPFAPAPDIIRSNQKDAYFQNVLFEQISIVTRNVYGSRFLHNHTTEAHRLSELLYFCCTTVIGNRTLGEEYCDIIPVEARTLQLPSIVRQTGYALSSIVLPYFLAKALPRIRQLARSRLQASILSMNKDEADSTLKKLQAYLVDNISTWLSPAPIYALSLCIFYFTGSYYHLSKRLFGLRYIVSKRIEASENRVGYEVLGFLMVSQLIIQTWLHARQVFGTDGQDATASVRAVALNGALSKEPEAASEKVPLEIHTNTPNPAAPRHDLSDQNTLQWIEGRQQRKCTLCLEGMKDPGAATCGHVFCWICIADWIKEKPECPLCRQAVFAQHVLPLRA